MDTPVSSTEELTLRDPDAPHVRLILRIYSMETFVYRILNTASWVGDKSKINTLGPFALVLASILCNEAP
jgi:hypothetical protein